MVQLLEMEHLILLDFPGWAFWKSKLVQAAAVSRQLWEAQAWSLKLR